MSEYGKTLTLYQKWELIGKQVNYKKKPAGPDGLFSSFFKNGDQVFKSEFTKFLGSTWAREEIYKNWCEFLIRSIYRKGDRVPCGNDRGNSLVSIASKPPASITSRRLSGPCERYMHETQAGFRPGTGCIDPIFTL